MYPSIFLNSSLVRSARWFKPTKWVCSPFSYSALCFWTNSWLSAKIFRRSSFSSSESYVLPCFCVHSWKRSLSDPTSFVAFSPSAALSWLILAAAAWRSCLSWRVSEGTMRAAVAPGRATSSSMSAARKRITRRVIVTLGLEIIAVVYPARSRAAGEVSRATRIETGGFGNTIRVCEVSRHPRWLCTRPGACACGARASSPGEVASDVDVDQIFPGDDSKGTPEIGRQNPVRATEARIRRVWVRWRGVCAPWISPRNVTERPPSAGRSLDMRLRGESCGFFVVSFHWPRHIVCARAISAANPDPKPSAGTAVRLLLLGVGLGFVDLHLVCFPVESDTR